MATLRPGLTSPTGHAKIITAAPLTTTDVLSIVNTQTNTAKEEVLQEITLTIPSRGSGVTSFNGLTGDVVGVSSFNGITGSVSFVIDGGEY